jgi:hypothetical protein
MKNLIACLLGIILILEPAGRSVAWAAKKDKDKDKDEDRLNDCGAVLKEILDIPDKYSTRLTRQGQLCSRLSLRVEGRIRGWW